MENKEIEYSKEPRDKAKYTESRDRLYTRFAGFYDLAVKVLPFWRRWLEQSIPHIRGPRVLEVSFGTGELPVGRELDGKVTNGLLEAHRRHHKRYGRALSRVWLCLRR